MSEPPSHLPPALRAFAHRDFRLFWSGQFFSLIGTWMQSVAQAWLVLELTDSPFRLGLVSTLQFTPILLFAVFTGALADRLPKRRLLLVSQSVLCLQASLLAALVWLGHVQYWHVAALATLYGLANSVDMPARQSFIVEMVGKADLQNAVAINSAMFNGARVIGPALAGLVIARWGEGPAFILNALSFVPVFVALLAMRAPGAPPAAVRRRLSVELFEGLAYAWRTPRISIVLGLVVVVSAFLMNNNVLVPLVARKLLHEDAHVLGLMMAALGVGAVGGAVTLAALSGSRPRLSRLAAAALTLGGAIAALATVHGPRSAAALLLVTGFCGVFFMASANTTLQLAVPDELRGRMMSLYALAFTGVTPFGAILLGSVIEAFGVRIGLVIAGGVGVVAVAGILAWRARAASA